tara:strand:- start:64 stop:366 length:303 start_codon:yes stop_codon:yes gene_type:complete
MRYVDVSKEYVASVLEAVCPGTAVKEPIVEAKDAPVEEVVNEEVEEHVCPLCESELDEALSDESLQECLEFIMDTINELNEEEGETLEEAEEEVEEELED